MAVDTRVSAAEPGAVAAAPPRLSGPRPVRRALSPRAARTRNVVLPIVVFVALIGLGYLIALYYDRVRGLPFLVPYPHLVVDRIFLDADFRPDLLEALGNTALIAVIGLAIAIVLGVAWAVLMVQAKWIESALFPYAVVLQCIPILALVPLIGSLFGYEMPSRIIVTVMFALFPMVANTLFGLQSIDRGQRELFQLQGASRLTLLVKLRFPAALPSIFIGLRNSAGLSVIGAIVADQFFQRGRGGLGVLISVMNQRLNGAEMFAAIVVASALGVLVFVAFGWLRRLAIGRWYDAN
ncbi:NitT/TauT family transport system permease protein [Frigoribacterium sp. PhB160]|jgi:NitT/TauT family transport system permease protein|uniref:ABC transporter permease n=1 Tax=Frigoribacterium sp. PhB160 TaxID=2485192 RepID=UPI000F49BA2E|nr:ABC transporter permease [Frigoribacterium sp. PhB160]ROS59280.1 NitT/TauT family transport system permease protein [Frigoribacterium sp. PhB160]